MVILSQTAIYALKATMYLAETEEGRPVRVDDIAEALDVPRNYLSKILSVLTRTGVLHSARGPSGGFRLAHVPSELSLSDVIAPFDDIGASPTCFLGGGRCSDATPCAAHARWKGVSAAVRDFLDRTTLDDLTRDASPGTAALPLSTPA